MGLSNQEHVMKLCLPPELHLATIKFQAQHEIGRPYAGLLLLTKALYQEKLIGREAYELFTMRYSRKLVNEENETQRVLTPEDRVRQQKLEQETRFYDALVRGGEFAYHSHDLRWLETQVKLAQKWKDQIPDAAKVIEMGEELIAKRMQVLKR